MKLLLCLVLSPSLVADMNAPRGKGQSRPRCWVRGVAFGVQKGGFGRVRRRCLAEVGCCPGHGR